MKKIFKKNLLKSFLYHLYQLLLFLKYCLNVNLKKNYILVLNIKKINLLNGKIYSDLPVLKAIEKIEQKINDFKIKILNNG